MDDVTFGVRKIRRKMVINTKTSKPKVSMIPTRVRMLTSSFGTKITRFSAAGTANKRAKISVVRRNKLPSKTENSSAYRRSVPGSSICGRLINFPRKPKSFRHAILTPNGHEERRELRWTSGDSIDFTLDSSPDSVSFPGNCWVADALRRNAQGLTPRNGGIQSRPTRIGKVPI